MSLNRLRMFMPFKLTNIESAEIFITEIANLSMRVPPIYISLVYERPTASTVGNNGYNDPQPKGINSLGIPPFLIDPPPACYPRHD